MFFRKKGKKKDDKGNSSFIKLSDIDEGYAKYAKDVKVERIDVKALAAEMNARAQSLNLKRLYVISRDSIKLSDAQAIVLHAAEKNPVFVSAEVPLVWCSAYPDAMYGKISLQELLLGYVIQSEGETYLKRDSKVIKDEGKHNNYDYLLIALLA